jgi:hypothetical protein
LPYRVGEMSFDQPRHDDSTKRQAGHGSEIADEPPRPCVWLSHFWGGEQDLCERRAPFAERQRSVSISTDEDAQTCHKPAPIAERENCRW